MTFKMEAKLLRGSCLCKAVTILVEGQLEHQPEACHCVACRKQSGNFLTSVNVRNSKLTIQGNENVGWYESYKKVARGFCSRCGSTLFWKPNLEGYEWIAVAMGLFDERTGTRISKHTFVGEKGDYYDIDDGLTESEDF